MNGNNRTASDNAIYFDSFGSEHIPKEIKNKNTIINNYRKQAYDSIMYGYFCFGFIHFMLEVQSLHECTNLFSPNNYEKNDEIILKPFQ